MDLSNASVGEALNFSRVPKSRNGFPALRGSESGQIGKSEAFFGSLDFVDFFFIADR